MNEYFNPEIILNAYANGYFPMAESRDGELYWHSPDPRAVIPLNAAKRPRSLNSFYRKHSPLFEIDARFVKVMKFCSDRNETWINDEILENYEALFRAGYAHSVETIVDGEMVGGLYGVAIGGAFFGESMFSKITGASKAAFYFLVDLLKKNGYALLDTQYLNDHTALLGAIEIPRKDYMKLLEEALEIEAKFEIII